MAYITIVVALEKRRNFVFNFILLDQTEHGDIHDVKTAVRKTNSDSFLPSSSSLW
jgi:hypothetical protein